MSRSYMQYSPVDSALVLGGGGSEPPSSAVRKRAVVRLGCADKAVFVGGGGEVEDCTGSAKACRGGVTSHAQ